MLAILSKYSAIDGKVQLSMCVEIDALITVNYDNSGTGPAINVRFVFNCLQSDILMDFGSLSWI